MADVKEITVPDIGDFDAVDVIEVLVSVGDTVEAEDSLITLESDKATMEVPAPFAGKITEPKLAGVALGAVPLVAVTAVETGRPYVIARKQAKEYGTGNRIEGKLQDGEEVVVLEDIATTGTSAVEAAEALREAGAEVDRVLVVVDREEGAAENLAGHDLELDALVTAGELLAGR